MAANSLPNVTAIGVALADRNGQQEFLRGASSFTRKLEQADEGGRNGSAAPVVIQTATLDSLLFERGLPAPDFIKVDVEGAEALVRMGGGESSPNSLVLFIELHGSKHAAAVRDVPPEGVCQWNHVGAKSG